MTRSLSVPPSKAFVHINPVLINFDLNSCLWFSSFVLNLHESLLRTNHVASSLSSPSTSSPTDVVDNPPNLMYMDVKVEVIMPRVMFEAVPGSPQQKDRPKSMQIQVSRFAMTNIREMGATRADLAQAISSLQEGSLVFGSGFPSKTGDMCIVTDRILSHIAAKDVTVAQPTSPLMQSAFSSLTRYALWSEPRDVWCMKLDPVWVDFYGTRSVGLNRAIPFVDAVPVTIWLHGRSDDDFLSNHITKPNVPEENKIDISSKRHSNNSNLINSSDSLILSVSNLKQSLELDSMGSNHNKEKSDNGFLKRNSTSHHPLIGDNVKKKSNDSEHCPLNSSNVPVDSGADTTKTADLHIIAHVSNLVSVQIDHYQYLFLLRLAEELTELTTFLSLDSKRILQAVRFLILTRTKIIVISSFMFQANIEKSIIVGCVIPQVEVSLVMPSQTPGKESSGGDGESVLPDSASLGDDLLTDGSVVAHTKTIPLLECY